MVTDGSTCGWFRAARYGSAGIEGDHGAAFGVPVAGDFNADGRTDFYVANDLSENLLWLNQGDGRFVDDALFAGAAVNADGRAEASMGVTAADFDGDGDTDLFMTHLIKETNTLYINDGQGWFTDGSAITGIAFSSIPYTGFGTGWIDVDNDGDLDLFSANGEVSLIDAQRRAGDEHPLRQRNQLWLNDGKGNYEEAEGPAVYARLGELYLAKKEYEKAVEHLTHALALEPAINQLHYPLGLAYRGLGNRELAMHHMSLRGTVKVQPADPLQEKLASLLRGYRGHVTEGRLALTAGRYEKAATSFRKAIDEDPTRATVWRLLAQTDLQLERPEEALANLKEALRLDPEDLIAHALIGDVFIDLGESDKAIIHLKKFARANQQDATVTYKLAWALANNGRFEESIDYYEKSLALDPTRAVIWLEFITMLKNMSDHKLALAKSVLAAEKLPGEPTILANLVLVYAHSPDKQVRDGEKAVEVAKRLYHMESDFETARLVAISYAENDQCDKAVEWIDKTISMAKASMQGDFDLLIQACFRIEWQSQA